MHRVLNVGSVLQAYALSVKIEQLGVHAEIIDYEYPNEFHKGGINNQQPLMESIRLLPKRLKYFVLYRSAAQKRRFQSFCKSKMRLSRHYSDHNELLQNPPHYDLYLTGSDQVWNPICMKGDGAFFFDFVKEAVKASYASSFSTTEISPAIKNIYAKYLGAYSYIGVREVSAISLVKDIANKDARLVCDPTLLLTKNDYVKLAKGSELKSPNSPYILVYALSYAFDPYPQIQNIVNTVKEQLGYKVVYLFANSVDHYHIGQSITSAGPLEFLDLFLNAKFVVTSSFHGTAFAINFEVPFISVIPGSAKKDSRIRSLLETLDLSSQAITTNQVLPKELPIEIDYDSVRIKLDRYRGDSEKFLKQILAL